MATVKEIQLMDGEEQVTPVVLTDSLYNSDGSKLMDLINDIYKNLNPIFWRTVNQNVFTGSIKSICYGNGKFIALDVSSNMAYSTDGINWTRINQNAFFQIDVVCYGDGKFVAGGLGATIYSTDGINWTRGGDAFLFDMGSICYGNGKFLIGGMFQIPDPTNPSSLIRCPTIKYSTDGINWNESNWPTPSISIEKSVKTICYGEEAGKFVASDGIMTMAYSTDGIDWTEISTSAIGKPDVIGYGDRTFVAGEGTNMAYSNNGTSWQTIDQNVFIRNREMKFICYGNGRFIAGNGFGAMANSTNHLDWSANSQSVFTDSIKCICYGDGKFVAGGSGGKMAYSYA